MFYVQNNYTPLHLSLKRQHVGVASLLLRAGSDIEASDDHGERAIHYAARSNLLQICQTLCSSGCNVNVPNKTGLYPLHLGTGPYSSYFDFQVQKFDLCKYFIE